MSEWTNGPGLDVVQGPDPGRGRTWRVVTATATVLFGLSAIAVLVAQRDTDGANRTDVSSLPVAELVRKAPSITMAEGSARVSVEERFDRSFGVGASGTAWPRREGAIDFESERGWLKAGDMSGDGQTASGGPETRYLGNVIYENIPLLSPISGTNSRSITGSAGSAVAGPGGSSQVLPAPSVSNSADSPQTLPAPSVVTTIPDGTQPPVTSQVPGTQTPTSPREGGVHIRERIASIGGGSWQPAHPWTRYDIEALEASGLPGAASIGASVANRSPARSMRVLERIGDDVRSLGSEQIRGVDTTHFAGSVDLEKVTEGVPTWPGELMGSALGAGAMKVDVWLDSDGRVRRLATVLETGSTPQYTSEGTSQYMSTLELYDFGIDVVVEAPPGDQVNDFLEQMRDQRLAPPSMPMPLPPPPPVPVPLTPPPPVTTIPE